MIEIKQLKGVKKYKNKMPHEQQYDVLIDGSIVEGAMVNSYDFPDEENKTYDIVTLSDEATEKLSAYSLSQLSKIGIKAFRLKYSSDWLEVLNQVWILPELEEDEEIYKITLLLNKVSLWQREYSFAEYYGQLVHLIKESKNPNIELMTEDSNNRFDEYVKALMPMENFAFAFKCEQPELPLCDEIIRCSEILRSFHKQVEKALNTHVHDNSVVMSFDFPEEVRVPCEQYLLYFIQFLKDLGVEATAELQHEAGQVLFAVTPTDKQTALDKIRTALETYLQLTANPVNDASSVEYEIAVQRLAANVDHLKGQLRLAHAELRLAAATAQTQQVTINNLLDGQFFIESMKNVTPKPEEDKEELLGGTVALTKFNWKGVELNFPEIFRRLRQMFSEDK